MVNDFYTMAVTLPVVGLTLAEAATELTWQQLEASQRFRLVAALSLLAMGGIALICLAWMMLRAGRRSSRREDRAVERLGHGPDPDDWARSSLHRPSPLRRERRARRTNK